LGNSLGNILFPNSNYLLLYELRKMKEEVELIDGSKAEVPVRHLLPRKAFSIVRQLLKITNMKESENGQEMIGDFSGIIEIMPICIDNIVADCPQKEQITIKSMKELYEKYAENTIGEVMTSVGIGLKKK
jgi:hypothetical protein